MIFFLELFARAQLSLLNFNYRNTGIRNEANGFGRMPSLPYSFPSLRSDARDGGMAAIN